MRPRACVNQWHEACGVFLLLSCQQAKIKSNKTIVSHSPMMDGAFVCAVLYNYCADMRTCTMRMDSEHARRPHGMRIRFFLVGLYASSPSHLISATSLFICKLFFSHSCARERIRKSINFNHFMSADTTQRVERLFSISISLARA